MDSAQVSKTCVDLCFTKRDKLIKMCMQNAFDSMRNGSDEEVPKDSSIISYIPSKERFVDYASEITRVVLPAKEIAKLMMVPILDKFKRSSRNKRRITFDSDEEEEEEEEQEIKKTPSKAKRSRRSPSPPEESQSTARSRRRARREAKRPVYVPPPEPESDEEPEPEPEQDHITQEVQEATEAKLPMPLGETNSGSMTCVSREYFPDAEFVFPGIYILPGDSGYVLFCVDNSRYSNSWNHSRDVTTFTWVTAIKDRSRSVLTAISESNNVFVFRKISGETTFRYVGKKFRSENVDKRAGTVDMSVC